MKDGRVDKIAEVFTAPLIVHRGGWEDTIPEWLRQEVILQRMARLKEGDDNLTTDAEAAAYLYCASLTAPMDGDWTSIFCHLVSRLMDKRGSDVPPDVRVDKLIDYQESELRELKSWIRDSGSYRGKGRSHERSRF